MARSLTISDKKTALIWCLVMVWLVYSGFMLWHLKEKNGWVASICRTPQ